ncbi:MAG: DMT family transporter [Deferribacteraceae bacterium]|jgi:drug/metabolite transporter (DMT)-like permease|nr:DMT family transporter [Deferribacteraceae bacterium]
MKSGIIYGVLAGALWGLVFLVPSILHDFSPIFLTFSRYLVYGLVSFFMVLPQIGRIVKTLDPKHIPLLIKYVFAGNILYYIFTATAVQYIGVAPVSLIEGLVPVAALFFRGKERDSIPMVTLAAPLGLIFAGLLCINADVFTMPQAGTVATRVIGLISAFAALIIWSWYAASNSIFLKENPRYTSSVWSALLGVFTGIAALLLGVVLFLTDFGIPSELPTERWILFAILILFLAFGASWLGNGLWNAASRRLPVSLTGQMIVFETFFALLYGFIYYSRMPRGLEVAAITLLIGGVLWSVRKHIT